LDGRRRELGCARGLGPWSREDAVSVDFSVSDGVGTILFNRPDKLNALTGEMWDELDAALTRCQRDPEIRAVILTGAGRGFCAGADIGGGGRPLPRPGPAGPLESMAEYNDVIRKLYHLKKPTIAAVRGAAVGIAWTMALCCDWILAAESANFRPAFLNLAKVPEGGFMYLVSRLVGELKARDIIYRARFVSGREAVEMGLATRLVGDNELMDEAIAIAREAAGTAPVTFALTKRLFNAGLTSFDQFVDAELNAIAIGAVTEDAREAMKAFREKRPGEFVGY
jgi:2-(1,2-epoxy-1,2-dihydrophenyl)acetyl-CoA isomerase